MQRKMKISLYIATIMLCGMTVFLCFSVQASDRVVINEVCSHNFSVTFDNNGNASDYIELYNPSNIAVSLTGYSLSDKYDDLRKCNLDSVIIGPKSYMTIYADGSSRDVIGYAAFEVGKEGETIYFSNAEGKVIDSVEIPELEYNTCYARVYDAGNEWERKQPTPGRTNDEAEIVLYPELREPVFSHESGFYENAFELEIVANKGECIYYTLDGSYPDTTSCKYERPLLIGDVSTNENKFASRTDLSPEDDYTPDYNIDKATVIRAVSYNEKTGQISEVSTKTYFVNYQLKNGYTGVSVASIVSDPDNFFDYHRGIYVNGVALQEYKDNGGMQEGKLLKNYVDSDGKTKSLYNASNAKNKGKDWEREASFTFFDEERQCVLEQDIGIRISGQSSRRYLQKSFILYARDIYDEQNILEYDFFEDGSSYSSIKLRNGGSDNCGSKIIEPFLHALVEGRNISTQKSRPCVLFLNGEYWGVYNIRERYKEEYFQKYYGINENDILMLDAGAISLGGWDAWNEFSKVLSFIEQNDMTIDENYNEVCMMLDMQSFIDFFCTNIYIDNQDFGFEKNIGVWRSKTVGDDEWNDGKWRLMLYDVDHAIKDYKCNSFYDSIWWKDIGILEEEPLRSLLRNEHFKEQFCITFMDMSNYIFEYERVKDMLIQWDATYSELVPLSHQRFGERNNAYQEGISNIDVFFRNRNEYITNDLSKALELEGTKAPIIISSNVQGGKVILNTLQLNLEKEWSGEYYTDYPITVTAVPIEGYHFVGWSGDVQSKEQEMIMTIPPEGIYISANFEKTD